jgi:hypothetical protein
VNEKLEEVSSTESDRQSARSFARWPSLGIHLTPDGEKPSHPQFLPVDYSQIARLIETLVENQKLPQSVAAFIESTNKRLTWYSTIAAPDASFVS